MDESSSSETFELHTLQHRLDGFSEIFVHVLGNLNLLHTILDDIVNFVDSQNVFQNSDIDYDT